MYIRSAYKEGMAYVRVPSEILITAATDEMVEFTHKICAYTVYASCTCMYTWLYARVSMLIRSGICSYRYVYMINNEGCICTFVANNEKVPLVGLGTVV